MKNEKIITDFLTKYFKLGINSEGQWTILNLMDSKMSIDSTQREINDVFGVHDDYKLILYNWLIDRKAIIARPVYEYLSYYYITMNKFGWIIKKRGTNEELSKSEMFELFKKDYESEFLDRVMDDWSYEQKLLKNWDD